MPALSKTIDIPNIFVASWTYELPFHGARGTISRALVEGWNISAITNFQSGDPLDVRVSASRLNTGSGNWADQTCGTVGTPGVVSQWFDTSCFADPAQFAFGNYKIGNVRGPTVFNIDFSAAKRTVIGRTTAEFRADDFNLFNRAHFSNPNVTFGNRRCDHSRQFSVRDKVGRHEMDHCGLPPPPGGRRLGPGCSLPTMVRGVARRSHDD